MSDGLAEESARTPSHNQQHAQPTAASTATSGHHHQQQQQQQHHHHHSHHHPNRHAHIHGPSTDAAAAAAPDIDSDELVSACRRLGISGPLEPLMRELKSNRSKQYHHHAATVSAATTTTTTHISRGDQMSSAPRHHRKTASTSATRSSASRKQQQLQLQQQQQQQQQQYHHFLDDASGGGGNAGGGGGGGSKGTYGQESWGRDSGARDLSPAERAICSGGAALRGGQMTTDIDSEGVLMTAGDTQATTSSMIHLANQLQVAALSALKTEVLELSARLQNSERERDVAQRKLTDAMEERERSQRRLESIGATHESRITEMHCIIVELNRKLKTRQDNAIMEEHEPEGSVSELSFQDGSVYNSEMECTNHDDHEESPTEPLDVKLVQPVPRSCESPATLPPPGNSQIQVQAMHEEILHLRGQVALLQSQLAATQRDNQPTSSPVVVDEQHTQAHDDRVVTPLLLLPASHSPRARSAYTSDDLCETAEIFEVPAAVGDIDRPVARRRADSAAKRVRGQRHAEQSSSHYHASASVTLPTPQHHPRHRSADRTAISAASDSTTPHSDEDADDALKRLQRDLKHARLQNNILTLTVAESRAHANRLYLLCGKYESNAIALHQALCCSDRAVEAYDVMLALLESRLAIVESHGSGGGGGTMLSDKCSDGSEAAADSGADAGCSPALESRRAAEAVAQHLLQRLARPDVGDEQCSWLGNSLGPWNEAIVLTAADTAKAARWTESDDRRLRAAVSKLKGQRATIQGTVVALEAPFAGADFGEQHVAAVGDDLRRHCDLETAVLAQEVVGLQMELSHSRQRAEHAVRDRTASYKRAAAMQEALLHLQAQLADTEQRLVACTNAGDRSSYSEAEHAVGIERELVEALARESRLKARLQGLAGSVEAANKSSEEKYQLVQCTVAELKQTNMSLTQSLDRCRRKYQTRLRRLEQQMSELTANQQQKGMAAMAEADADDSPVLAGGGASGRSAVPETTL